MVEIIAENWSHLYKLIFADTYNDRLKRYKSRFAFRGLSDKNHQLKTSLMRLGGGYKHVEKHLLRQFKKYGHQKLNGDHNEWYWLSVAQHYGLPTRLMDWSYSPEVALHFATSNLNKYNVDGAIWKVNYRKAHSLLPNSLNGLKSIVSEEMVSIFTVDHLNGSIKDLNAMNALGEKSDFFLFFEPPSIDERIFNQFAYFSIGSRPDLSLDEWLENHKDIWHKIIIPKEIKWEIRDKLDQSNVSERILFPGLSGIASWLTRYYTPTGEAVNE